VEAYGRREVALDPQEREVDQLSATPVTEHATEEASLGDRISWCELRFAGVNLTSYNFRRPAKFARVDARDTSTHKRLAHRLALMIDDDWQVDEQYGRPTVVISVVGSQDDFKLAPRVQRLGVELFPLRAGGAATRWVRHSASSRADTSRSRRSTARSRSRVLGISRTDWWSVWSSRIADQME